jgi:hypothetical protein
MEKANIIYNILNNTKLKLKPSRVCDGVGVFSICKIKKDEKLFSDIISDTMYISWDDLKGISKSTKSYLRTIANVADGGIYLSRTPNNINLAYYVNHSNNPNVYHNLDTDEFHAICDIDEDIELVSTYSDSEIDWK